MAEEKAFSKQNRVLKIAVALLIVLSLVLLIALIVVAVNAKNEKESATAANAVNGDICADQMKIEVTNTKAAGLFEDLTADEIIAVRDYMLQQNDLNITKFEDASINTNWIYLIELQQPSKAKAVAYLDDDGDKPERTARVVVYEGGAVSPKVQEYLVSPAGQPKRHKSRNLGPGKTIPFHARPTIDSLEAEQVDNIMKNLTKHAYRLLNTSYDGFTYYNCTVGRCLTWANAAPTALKPGERKLWVWFMRDVPGITVNPVGFEARVNTEGTDVSRWGVEKIYFNNKTYDTVEELMEDYDQQPVKKVLIEAPSKPFYGSFERRGDPQPKIPMRGPRQFEPDGKRYAVKGRHVEYMGWSFDFRVRTTSGLQLFDIQFKGKRIVYELSIQEALAFYSGWAPTRMFLNYLDDSWRMGSSTFELARGIDCPETATFFDLWHYLDTGKPRKYSNAACVFEFNTGTPLRRHFNDDFKGGYSYYGGMVSNVLILRTVTTPYNYDYVHDYIFYPNGVIEVRAAFTGYVSATYWASEEKPYATEINPHVAGPMHDHMINYKVDLDILGTKNDYGTITVGYENITNRWYPDLRHVQKTMKYEKKSSEKDALYKYNFETPKYLLFSSAKEKNAMGMMRSYRIQINDMMKQMYPDDWYVLKDVPWSKYQLSVTKYKEEEERSSSIYNQNDPFNPVVNFQNFTDDDEDIQDEDLVAWVTMGALHIPHAEDIPVTATSGNTVRFFIRPFNYFDEDPSVASRDTVIITPKDKQFSGVNIERFGTPSGAICTPRDRPLEYKGTYY